VPEVTGSIPMRRLSTVVPLAVTAAICASCGSHPRPHSKWNNLDARVRKVHRCLASAGWIQHRQRLSETRVRIIAEPPAAGYPSATGSWDITFDAVRGTASVLLVKVGKDMPPDEIILVGRCVQRAGPFSTP
jgi:hypothetical protein